VRITRLTFKHVGTNAKAPNSSLTAGGGLGHLHPQVGCESGRAGHTGALLLETRAVCVDGAGDLGHACASGIDGIVEALGVDAGPDRRGPLADCCHVVGAGVGQGVLCGAVLARGVVDLTRAAGRGQQQCRGLGFGS
jgi:hypothetical protein